MPTPLRDRHPRRLGRYELVSRLGEGGMGAVYLGRAPEGELVAIKVIQAAYAAESESRERFRREVAAAQKVARFCTAPVVDADLDGERPYIVSEYVDGPTLYDVVAESGFLDGTLAPGDAPPPPGGRPPRCSYRGGPSGIRTARTRAPRAGGPCCRSASTGRR